MLIVFQSHFTQTCGNSIVERGEECDCGSEEVKRPPPFTCTIHFLLTHSKLARAVAQADVKGDNYTPNLPPVFYTELHPFKCKPGVYSSLSYYIVSSTDDLDVYSEVFCPCHRRFRYFQMVSCSTSVTTIFQTFLKSQELHNHLDFSKELLDKFQKYVVYVQHSSEAV